jgi:3-deoxy-7-phosphoheptulonate synthase
MAGEWTPGSWRGHLERQQPVYPDATALAAALRDLGAYSPLVPAAAARRLHLDIADAQLGKAFLLQGGECAESFAEYSPGNIQALHGLLSAMAQQIEAAAGVPVIRTARIAGQFAKPRSADSEEQGGRTLPMYRGDIVNGIGFDEQARTADPERMFRAYAQSAATLSHLRALDGDTPTYTCHEALLLPYEQALVRRDGALWHGSSAHFLWVGDRTRFRGSAHVEFLHGLSNPLGIKCGPSLEPDLLLHLLNRLNPARTAGRITLISRMGAERIGKRLPPLLRAVAAEGHPVLWSCDPMHGNTIKANGYKTRPLSQILRELGAFFALCRAEGFRAGGVHVEMTGRDVAECTGGTEPVREADLGDRYHTHCDPRLNPAQAMEVAALAAAELEHDARARAA